MSDRIENVVGRNNQSDFATIHPYEDLTGLLPGAAFSGTKNMEALPKIEITDHSVGKDLFGVPGDLSNKIDQNYADPEKRKLEKQAAEGVDHGVVNNDLRKLLKQSADDGADGLMHTLNELGKLLKDSRFGIRGGFSGDAKTSDVDKYHFEIFDKTLDQSVQGSSIDFDKKLK